MAQRHQLRGNVIVPITDHFGFGLPGAPGNLDSATGPRMLRNAGNPNAVLVATKGSICVDPTTPGLWFNTTGTNFWNAVGGVVGAVCGMLPMRDAALVDPDHPVAIDDTDVTTPFITIQAAITALENAAFVESGGTRTPYSSAAQMKVWTVVVAQGIYDESLLVPAGLFFALVARGTVVLGDGTLANLQSSNTRNIVVLGDTNNVPATPIFPGLVLTTWSSAMTDRGGAGVFSNVGSWKISGRIMFSEAGAVGTFGGHLFSFDGVDVADNSATGSSVLDLTGSNPSILVTFRRCRFETAVTLNVANGTVALAEETRFEGALTGASFGTFERCVFNGDVTLANAAEIFEATGIIDCDWGTNGTTWTGSPDAIDDYSISRLSASQTIVTGAVAQYGGINGTLTDPGGGAPGPTLPIYSNAAMILTVGALDQTNPMPAPQFAGQRVLFGVAAGPGAGSRALTYAAGWDTAGTTDLYFRNATDWALVRAVYINGGTLRWRVVNGNVGGDGIMPLRDGAIVDPDHPEAVDDDSINTPFVTIQAAIDALENKALVESGGGPVFTSAAQMKVYTVVVAQGIYDEDLTIPAGLSFSLIARGVVVLGDGAAAGLNPTNNRDINWNVSTAVLPATYTTPMLQLCTWGNGMPTTLANANPGNWKIGGSIIATDAGAGASGILSLDGVTLLDIDATGYSVNDTNLFVFRAYLRRCHFAAEVNLGFGGPNGYLPVAEECVFMDALTGTSYGTLDRCRFNGTVTFTGGKGSYEEPDGLIDCDFATGLSWASDLYMDAYTARNVSERAVVPTGVVRVVWDAQSTIGDPGGGAPGPTLGIYSSGNMILTRGALNDTNPMPPPLFEGQVFMFSCSAGGGMGSRRLTSTWVGGWNAAGNVNADFWADTDWMVIKGIEVNNVLVWRVVAYENVMFS